MSMAIGYGYEWIYSHHPFIFIFILSPSVFSDGVFPSRPLPAVGNGNTQLALADDHQLTDIAVDIPPEEATSDLTSEILNSRPPPLSPLNVSIDLVDHLEKCLANLPNTINVSVHTGYNEY